MMAETQVSGDGNKGGGVAVAIGASGWSDYIKELGDSIADLTLIQAVELGEYLKLVHGLKPAAAAAIQQQQHQQEEAKPQTVVQTEFSVVLEGLSDPSKKIGVIKVFREITAMGLKEAKDAVENAPKVVKENMPKAEADKLAAQLKDAGANVSVK